MSRDDDPLRAVLHRHRPRGPAKLRKQVYSLSDTLWVLVQQFQERARGEERDALAAEAWKLATPLLDALESDEKGPHPELMQVLMEPVMAIVGDGGGVWKQEAPDEDDTPSCCITRIRFENVSTQTLRVTASGELGAEAQEEFRRDARHWLRRTDDRDDSTVPGGLGRCVTVRIEVADESGAWRELVSEPVCCDTHAAGDVLSFRPPATGTGTRPRPQRLLRIVELEALTPCPGGGESMHTSGRHGSAHRPCTGRDIEGKGYFVGGHARFVYVPPDVCRRFCFIQAVRRTVTVNGRPTTASQGWHLDLEKGQRGPCYRYQSRRPEGGYTMNDSPGLANPWGALRLRDGSLLQLRHGDRLEIHWDFRTWAACLDPAGLFGQFRWGMSLELTVPRRRPPRDQPIPGSSARFDPPPTFQPRDEMSAEDERLVERLLG